jgi:intein-encoded DNA endonuclease-like protein
MAELKIICEYPDSLKQFIEEALSKRIASLKEGIRRTEEHIKEFEGKYQMSTEEFLRRFENDELQHRLDMEFDEWIGESRMLKGLQKEAGNLRGIEFVN